MDYRAVRVSDDEAGVALRMWEAGEHPKAPAGVTTGGQFVKAGADLQKAKAAKAAAAAKPKPPPAKGKPAPGKPTGKPTAANPMATYTGGVLAPGANNDPRHVAQLQQLLGALKLGNVSASGRFDDATAAAVANAQRRLGVKPTGHASASFIHKLQSAMALSPCVKSTRESASMGDEYRRDVAGMCVRAFDFEADASDGRILEGYAAVFNTRARIRDTTGDFDEVILPGAFRSSLERRTPVMQWEHGQDPRVGRVPIAAIEKLTEDSTGLHVRARLYDNPVIEPIRQAIAGGSVKGMSFRFQVPKNGQTWTRRSGEVDLREISDLDAAELGPVVFPAYDSTTVSVRSILAVLPEEERAALVRELAADVRRAVDLNDFTGRSVARSPDGGEPGDEPEDDDEPDGDESTAPSARSEMTAQQRLDHGTLRAKGILL